MDGNHLIVTAFCDYLFFYHMEKGLTQHSVVFATADWEMCPRCWRKQQNNWTSTSHCFSRPNNNKAAHAHSIIQTIPLHWTATLHCTYSHAHRRRRKKNKTICAHRLFYAPVNLVCLHILSWNGLGSDTNQCTSQVNPGEIEIHLYTSDYNQSAPRQV